MASVGTRHMDPSKYKRLSSSKGNTKTSMTAPKMIHNLLEDEATLRTLFEELDSDSDGEEPENEEHAELDAQLDADLDAQRAEESDSDSEDLDARRAKEPEV
ncbi:hypothetical protein PtB15_2B104 [Puccinia triticina]|nr:hypothetical protein PtB15_2B104 [Puccinia triticina]